MTAARYGAQDGDAEQRSRQTVLGRVLYWILWRVFYAAIFILFRLRVEGRENLPDGPFILSGIHRSFIDTPIIGMVTSRRRHRALQLPTAQTVTLSKDSLSSWVTRLTSAMVVMPSTALRAPSSRRP